jgi:hypothetical protein
MPLVLNGSILPFSHLGSDYLRLREPLYKETGRGHLEACIVAEIRRGKMETLSKASNESPPVNHWRSPARISNRRSDHLSRRGARCGAGTTIPRNPTGTFAPGPPPLRSAEFAVGKAPAPVPCATPIRFHPAAGARQPQRLQVLPVSFGPCPTICNGAALSQARKRVFSSWNFPLQF